MTTFKTLTHVALNLDGPLLTDSFAPIMVKVCENHGWEYSAEFERNTLSRNRKQVIDFFRDLYAQHAMSDGDGQSDGEMMESYWVFRAEYLQDHPIAVVEGATDCLKRLQGQGLSLICYGGLDEDYMRAELGPAADLLDEYICTNEFRPGVTEIVHRRLKISPKKIVFVDDVNFVAERARDVGTGFVGIPSQAAWSWQRRDMERTGVPCILNSIADLDLEILSSIDKKLAAGTFWPPRPTTDSNEVSAK